MLLAAAEAIADVVSPDQLNTSFIVPSVFDEKVAPAVARAIIAAVHPEPLPGGAKISI
jgi:malate dehydrogenase (oxaloacetate-decarboxylating)